MLEHYRAEAVRRAPSRGRDPQGRGHDRWNPAAARTAVKQVVAESPGTTGGARGADRPDGAALADALLVTSELITNAMLHGDGVTDFDVALRGHDLYLSVSDRNPRLPVVVSPVDDRGRRRCGGYGWPIVCRLSREVLVSVRPRGGKRITAVVPLWT
jgi:hypothetical protein